MRFARETPWSRWGKRFDSWRTELVQGFERRGRYANYVTLASLGGIFASTFPVTILTISLGPIAQEFGARETTVAWIISGPILFSAIALPLLGKLGDLRGHRRIFLLGFGAATLTAFATALAWDIGSLITLRILAAVLGAATQPTAMALILGVHSEEKRPVAMGWWSMTGAAAPAFGLVAGGPLVDWLGWRAVFVVQGGLSVVALVAALVILRETPRRQVRFDYLGTVALAIGVSGWMFALGRLRDTAIVDPLIWLSVVVGSLGMIAFVMVERRVTAPLLPLEFFGNPNFSAGILSNAFNSAAYMGAFAIAPLLFLGVFEYSILATAGIMLLRTSSLMVASPFGGRLGGRYGERPVAVVGCLVMTLGLALVTLGAATTSIFAIIAGLILQGIGHGLSQPPLTAAAVGAVPLGDLGIAAATNRLASQIGVAFGITGLMMVYGGNAAPAAFAAAFAVGVLLAAMSSLAAMAMRRPAREI